MPKIVHTADVHLGVPLGWLGERAHEQRQRIRETLAAVVDVAAAEQADCVIVAGDLFDSNSPPASDVRFVLTEFERLAADSPATVVVLPGSHDFLGPASVYFSYRREIDKVDRVKILGVDGRLSVELDDVGLSVRGVAARSSRSAAHQLAGLVPSPAHPYNVAVAHGSVNVVPTAPDDHPIDVAELCAPGWSYFALGHWHSWREIQGAAAPAVYPGAPEVIAIDQVGSGYVAVVDLTPEGARVERRRVGARSVAEAELDLTGVVDVADAAERVRGMEPPDPDKILRLTLRGLLKVDTAFDAEALRESLAQDYFHVAGGPRKYHVTLAEGDLEDLPERLVVGRFARLMRERCEAAGSEAERQEIEDALQLGVALLQGRNILG